MLPLVCLLDCLENVVGGMFVVIESVEIGKSRG